MRSPLYVDMLPLDGAIFHGGERGGYKPASVLQFLETSRLEVLPIR